MCIGLSVKTTLFWRVVNKRPPCSALGVAWCV
jgi:hypothetical protein